jgi:squalene-hopene/tetraprenyl-beta-curcumene cyclase
MAPRTTEITRLKNLFSRLSGSLLGAMPARLRTGSARPRLPLLRLIARNERLGAATETHPRRATGTALSQPDSIDEALRRSQAWLVSRQDPREGFWVAELEADATLISEYVMLRRFLGLSDPERERKVVSYLKLAQLADGGWAIYYGGPAEISAP